MRWFIFKMNQLDGKAAIITGAAQGVGLTAV